MCVCVCVGGGGGVCVYKRNHLPRHLMMGIYCIELYFKVIQIIFQNLLLKPSLSSGKIQNTILKHFKQVARVGGGGGGHKGKAAS